MADFLTTSGVNNELEAIIKGAQSGRLVLVSPFIQFSRQIKELIEDRVRHSETNIYVVYGKRELRPRDAEWLKEHSIPAVFREHLHAKCYMNDSHALVTSMNLYEFSQQNNNEMGILVSAKEDQKLYEEIRDEVDLILRSGNRTEIGYCLRCGRAVPFDLLGSPYCNTDYAIWATFENPAFPEKYCHECGKPHSTSMLKPLCICCFRKS